MDEDRTELNNEIQKFAQKKLRKVETKVKTGVGDVVIEKRTAKGITTGEVNNIKNSQLNQNGKKLDLQVGFVSEGFMIGSNDVATCIKTLKEYGITHVLNLAPNETQPFQYEDDFNYLTIQIDENTTKLKDVFEKCFDFIEDGQRMGNCFIHCSTTKPGLSRSTSICIAYLIYKYKKNYIEAFNDVKEARAFVRPSDLFAKQLQEYAAEQGAKQEKTQIEDEFTAKKRREIEEEKAMLSKAVNLKTKKNLFDKQAEETQRKQNEERMQQEKLMVNKLRNNPAFANQSTNNLNSNQTQPGATRKLTSLVSLFQQKDNVPIKPPNKIVLNSAPVKKWAPVSTPHLNRTIKPETKNYDFYSKVKRTKSKDFKRAESLRKSKSKLNNNLDFNNNEKLEDKQKNKPNISSSPSTLMNKENTDNKSMRNSPVSITASPVSKMQPITTISSSIPPPPPPPLPSMIQPIKSIETMPTITNQKQTTQIGLQHNPSKNSGPLPLRSVSSNTNPKVSATQSDKLIKSYNNNQTFDKCPTALESSNKLNNSITNAQPQNKLDQNRLNKFNIPNKQNSLFNDKCIDYSAKINPPKSPVEKVINIPIKIESSTNKTNADEASFISKKTEADKKIVELEVEESEEESEFEESEESEEESESDESEEESESEESEEETESDESSEKEIVSPNKKRTGGLSRSATQEILRMIKSKNDDINPLQAITEEDEDREIDLLLSGLEREGVENIDWSEFELSLDEIQNIIKNN